MLTWNRLCCALAIELASGAAWAQSAHPGALKEELGAVSGGGARYAIPYYRSIGPDGLPITYMPPLLMIVPGGLQPVFGPPMMVPPALRSGVGVAGPWPPPNPAPAPNLASRQPLSAPATVRKVDSSRSNQLVTYGDRHFRSGNLIRASERYTQAIGANPNAAAPRVRLAQVALVRGQYGEAAARYREAMIAEPGWLTNAPDIQSIYGEPSDFAKQIAKLESHLQSVPNDRDAWLVLGAQWYLSGKTRKAADVFLRLSDRKPDATLASFLDASSPHIPVPR